MDEPTVSLPIVEVALLEDRAHVVRRGRVRAGRSAVLGVSPLIVDRSLVARVAGSDAPAAARVERRRVLPDVAGEVAAIDRELEAVTDRIAALEGEGARLSAAVARLDTALDQVAREAVEDTRWDRQEPESLRARFVEARAAATERALRRLEVDDELLALRLRRNRLQDRRAQAARPDAREEARLVVEVAEDAEVSVEYLVPCACWRPAHRARLLPDGRVAFETEGCAWQNTGEDWTEVALSFSTERPSLGTEPPELHEEPLAIRKVGPTVAVETRQDAIQKAAVPGGPAEVPGIDDGGLARRLRARAPATVPSDGRPYRVPAGSWSAPAAVDRVCHADLVAAVLVRSAQVNAAGEPVLPGPVDLLRESGRVGRTRVGFVAPGERFELGWGPDPDLRVHRAEEQHAEEQKLLSSWTSAVTRVRVRLSNLGPHPREVLVVERVPVSEVEKVRVEVEDAETTPSGGAPARPDADGFVRWTVRLEPFGHAEVKLGYVLRKHDDVQGV